MLSRTTQLALVVLFSSSLHAASPPELALKKGESFTYRLSWGIFGKAAELVVSADEDPDAPELQTRITMATSTRGVIRAPIRSM
ncbi:MAG: hypothetical protein J6386_19320 [Candidatus Synoicihabitans palmerolidicus]|nr:hypothetical protein [Candidatus Synoicihabitans palmerolidicus]